LQVVLEERAVQNFPHRYAVRAAGTAEDVVVELASNGLTAVSTASPAEFGGPGDRWSPETLLVGAVADCFVLTFRAVAKASKLPWQSLACDAVGTLDRIEGVVRCQPDQRVVGRRRRLPFEHADEEPMRSRRRPAIVRDAAAGFRAVDIRVQHRARRALRLVPVHVLQVFEMDFHGLPRIPGAADRHQHSSVGVHGGSPVPAAIVARSIPR
jgi:hypothetical protein